MIKSIEWPWDGFEREGYEVGIQQGDLVVLTSDSLRSCHKFVNTIRGYNTDLNIVLVDLPCRP